MTTGPSLPPCPRCSYGGRVVSGADVWTPHGYAGRKRRYQCPRGHKWATLEVELGVFQKMLDDAAMPPVLGKVVSKPDGDNVVQMFNQEK